MLILFHPFIRKRRSPIPSEEDLPFVRFSFEFKPNSDILLISDFKYAQKERINMSLPTLASSTTPTQWIFVPISKDCSIEPVVLKDPIKFSDFFVSPNQNLKFENLEIDFIIDQDVDIDQRTIDIAARCIVVYPGITVRAKEIAFRAPNGYFNYGRLNYKCMESWAPRCYSAAEGEFVQGQGSQATKHSWPSA